MNDIIVIIPAYNEESGISKVLDELPENLVNEVVVVNNGSTDKTAENAKKHGATVLNEPKRGYGRACLKGLEYVASMEPNAEIIVFIDADYSDYPGDLEKLVTPIKNNIADLVIGSRALGKREKGSMTIPQVFGNWLATFLLKLIYRVNFTDLGPFRAIRYDKLMEIGMSDKNYGWTVEMQLKAAKKKLRTMEVPVNYKRRIGKSKVSGTIKGTFMAGYKILFTIFRYI